MLDLPDVQFLSDSAAVRTEPPFECSRKEGDLEAAWVHVAGALDSATTPRLVRTLRESQSAARLVVLDLRELAFIDSAGVHAIVEAGRQARRVGGRLVLLRGAVNVDRLLARTGSADEIVVGDLGAQPWH